MAKGGLGDESLKRTQKQIDSITNEMNRLRSVMSDAENANLDLFESKKSLNSFSFLSIAAVKLAISFANFIFNALTLCA